MELSKFLDESAQRTEQMKRRSMMKAQRDKEHKRAKDTRQHIKIGKLVCQYFPSLLDCQPSSGEKNSYDLAFFEFILKIHYNNPDIVHQLRKEFDRQSS